MPEKFDFNPTNDMHLQVVVPCFRMQAEENIPFGKLVSRATGNKVKLTSGNNDKVLGVADQYATCREEKDRPTGYLKDQDVVVKALLPGKIYLLCASTAIADNEFVCCSTSGGIEEIKPNSGDAYKIIGVSLEPIEAGQWGKVLIK